MAGSHPFHAKGATPCVKRMRVSLPSSILPGSSVFAKHEAADAAIGRGDKRERKNKERNGEEEPDDRKNQKPQHGERYRKGQDDQADGPTGPFFIDALRFIHGEPPSHLTY
jgi:hypothetical protein